MPDRLHKIAFITGKRGGFDAMLPTLKAMREHERLEPLVIACDQHNMPHMGNTIHHIIHEWGSYIETVTPDVAEYNSAEGRMNSISMQMCDMAQLFGWHKPDCILLIGDRAESVVAALVAHNMRIPIAHVQGGDRTGGVDDRQRYAITELSDLHLVSNREALNSIKGRVIWTATSEIGRRHVYIVGDPHIDPIALGNYANEGELKEQGYPTDPTIIVLQHPDTLDDIEVAEKQMRRTMIAVNSFDLHKIVIYPCSDQGHVGIVKTIKEVGAGIADGVGGAYRGRYSIYQNIPQYYFLALLERAACIVGNSSVGIIEAACFCVGAVNIGDRQKGRLQGENVFNTPHDTAVIKTAIESAMQGKHMCAALYGDGKAYTRIPQIILEFLDANT